MVLIARSGLSRHVTLAGPLRPPPAIADNEGLAHWVTIAARPLGVDAVPVSFSWPALARELTVAGPALLRLPNSGEPAYLLLLGVRRGRARLIKPDFSTVSAPVPRLADALGAPAAARVSPEIDQWLVAVSATSHRRARARRRLLAERLAQESVEGAVVLRSAPAAPFIRTLARANVPRRIAWFLVAHIAQLALVIGAWGFFGTTAFAEQPASGTLVAALLLLASAVPLQILETMLAGRAALDASACIKQRLLSGALRLDPEAVRLDGPGHHLARLIESEAIEGFLLSGAAYGIVAAVELAVAVVVLSAGVGGTPHAGVLIAWSAICGVLLARYYRGRRAWATDRLDLTNRLVERMAGHQTRLAQEAPERWHDREDEELESYATLAREMDDAGRALSATAGRGFLVIGIIGLVPAVLAGAAGPWLAISIGGVLYAARALAQLASSATVLVDVVVGWRLVQPLFKAATRQERLGSPALLAAHEAPASGEPILEAREMAYHYPGRAVSVIHGVSLQIAAGERVLIEGPSGGGKSTLGALMAGLREPTQGLLLLEGLDTRSLGLDGWRSRVAAAPQFHENHVFSASLAFNLLLGRRWPAAQADIDEAVEVLHALGLGPLLERMPIGIHQIVGDTGWQLSHGERSRLFLARALLQGADLVVLDESFASLDPETLRLSLRTVLERQRTAVVIAHP